MLQANVLQPRTLDILKKIMNNPTFSSFTLVGGTALALQLGHRLSIDLDFFSYNAIDHETIKIELETIGNVVENYRNKIMFRVELDQIKMDFVSYKFLPLKPQIVMEEIRLASIEDICGMKIEAIKNRGAKKDFYDLYFLLKDKKLKDIFAIHSIKYPGNNTLQLSMSLQFFEDADKDENPVLLREKPTWEEVKTALRNAVKEVV